MTTIALEWAASRAAWLVGLSLLVTPLRAAPLAHDLMIDGEPQAAGTLCWAAVGTMAVNAVAHPQTEMTQVRQAALFMAGIKPPIPPIPHSKLAALDSKLDLCESDISLCDFRGHPILEGVAQDLPPSLSPLQRPELTQQIGDQHHPVIIGWEYPDEETEEDPMGGHYLIATGYDLTTPDEFLTIWDPWNGGDFREISYEVYADPSLDMGLPKRHLSSTRALRKMGSTPAPPTGLTVDGSAASGATGGPAARGVSAEMPRFREVTFAAARRSLTSRQRAEVLRRRGAGPGGAAALTVGVPLPILALHINAIVANRQTPQKLLRTRTISALYPVMLRDEVVDSFLMANVDGKWIETGYSNVAVTKQLVRWRREKIGRSGLTERDFFVISVPHYSAFFMSFRPGPRAVAIAASTDRSIGTVEGRDQQAVVVLKNIAERELMRRAEAPR